MQGDPRSQRIFVPQSGSPSLARNAKRSHSLVPLGRGTQASGGSPSLTVGRRRKTDDHLSADPLHTTLRDHTPMKSEVPVILLAPVASLGLYGLGLLVAPETFASFWPRPIDAFHGRMYSVAFLTPALGAVLLWRAAAPVESLTMGLTQGTGGFIPMIGLVIAIGTVESSCDGSCERGHRRGSRITTAVSADRRAA